MTSELIFKFLLGLFCSGIIALSAHKKQLLTASGAYAMIFIGTSTCLLETWPTWGLMILFFASSAFIHFGKKIFNLSSQNDLLAKGEKRDAQQVLANSLPAILSLTLYFFSQKELFLVGYASAIAGATADTWGSEIGVLSDKEPRSILTLKTISKGLSGGVSLLGSSASLAGSLLIAIAFYTTFFVKNYWSFFPLKFLWIIFISGFFWVTNDLVNLLSGFIGLVLSFALFSIL